MKVAVVGRGRVGKTLARSLARSGIEARLVAGRAPGARAVGAADTIVLAVPDAVIRTVAAKIAPALRPGSVVLHVAGARTEDELAACAERGAAVGVAHPLASFASAARPPRLDGATLVVSGDARAVAAARAIARALGMRVVARTVHGPAYHAGAALVANGAAALADVGVSLLERLGLDRPEAARAVAGLLSTVAQNVKHVGVPEALTGPIRRGDDSTVEAHRRALEAHPRTLSAYDAVSRVILESALAAGLSPARARAVRRALGGSKKDERGWTRRSTRK